MAATTKPLPKIRRLPPNLINQIAAGEVIERPSSVVKELLENSIDAGASRVELTITGGGSELIRIADNGCGMTSDQLPLAVSSHATSKLPDDDTLFHVGTLGFRGEAIASIGSVSHLLIRSRTAADDSGSEITVRGGVVEPPVPCGCPPGTVIEVRNLFFNTPVRHRFLKTAQTERGHIVEAFTRLALANPHVHFVLTNNDKQLYDLPSTERWSERIDAFFGAEISESLIAIRNDDAEIRIDGYVCDPAVSRGNSRMQYLFLNGRHIRDRALQHALGEAYRGMLMVGRHPICFLRMRMPAELIDVNVHPCKLEVRFTDSGRIYSRVLQSLRHQFLTTDLKQRVIPPTASPQHTGPLPIGSQPTGVPQHPVSPAESTLGMPVNVEQRQRQEVINWARTGQTGSPSNVPGFQPFPDRSSLAAGPLPSQPTVGPSTEPIPGSNPETSTEPAPWDQNEPPEVANAGANSPSVSYLGFQVHNRYLVTQDDSGMVVIDQHALHERVLYERVCAKVLTEQSQLESQRLLVPEPVSLTPAERTAALEAKETLAKVGLEIDEFGGETILVQSVPAMLHRTAPGDMLRTLLESLISAGKQPDAKDLLNRLLSTIACKAAVKAGDPLRPEEITSLLEQKDLYHETHHCPHGRPTSLFFSRDELDRMFGRLGPIGKK